MYLSRHTQRIPADKNTIVSLDILGFIVLSMQRCVRRLVKMMDEESMGVIYDSVSDSVFQSIEPFQYFNFITSCNLCGVLVEVKPDFSDQILNASLAVIFHKKLFDEDSINFALGDSALKEYIEDNFGFTCQTGCPKCESIIYLWLENGQMMGDSSHPIILKPKESEYRESHIGP